MDLTFPQNILSELSALRSLNPVITTYLVIFTMISNSILRFRKSVDILLIKTMEILIS